MKLAEALIQRADIRKRMSYWNERMRTSAVVQEGERPAEEPQALLTEMNAMIEEFTVLTTRINRANLATTLADGTTLTEAIAARDAYALRISALTTAVNAATNAPARIGRAEIKSIATVDVAALRREIDEITRQRRTLDTAIQAMNWAAEME
jgi:hypothetical protein